MKHHQIYFAVFRTYCVVFLCICDIKSVFIQARASVSALEARGEERGHEAGEECEEDRGDESRQEREERKKDRGKERTHDGIEDRVHGRIGESGEVRTHTVEESEKTKEQIDYYIRPHHESLKSFFEYHPQQTSINPVVQKVFCCKDGTNRRWLTYRQERHALHCSACLAFAKSTDKSLFISGMKDWKRA